MRLRVAKRRELVKIFIANGAPRRDGFTEELVCLFAEGAEAAGAEVDIARLASLDVRPCRGCFACWVREDGSCAQRDDMDELLPRYLEADALVLATPVYYYSFSALLKAFIERLFPMSLPFIDVARETGLERNTPRFEGRGPSRAVLIAAGAHRDPRLTEGLVKTFETICHGMSVSPAGVLLRPESFLLDFGGAKQAQVGKVRTAFANAGRELVSSGRVCPETEKDASSLFTRDLELFRSHARAYWEIARAAGARAFDRASTRETAASDLRILIPELAASYDAGVVSGLVAVIQFDIAGDPEGGFHLVIDQGRCASARGRNGAASTTISLDAETLVALLHGRLDARAALAAGKIRVVGDRSLFVRFGRLFRR